MFEIFGIPSQALFGQLLIGLINGSFYALLSLGLAVIFGMLNIINFAHGAQYMIGAFTAFFLLNYAGLNYWVALVAAPIIVGAFGIAIIGSILNSIYTSNMAGNVAGLPPGAADAARNSVGAALQVSHQIGGPAGEALAASARNTFTDAMGWGFLAAAIIAFLGAVAILKYMPARHLGGPDHAGGADQLKEE